jgi:hypothetical protein
VTSKPAFTAAANAIRAAKSLPDTRGFDQRRWPGAGMHRSEARRVPTSPIASLSWRISPLDQAIHRGMAIAMFLA